MIRAFKKQRSNIGSDPNLLNYKKWKEKKGDRREEPCGRS